MNPIKISLFKELYYWMCFYVKVIMKNPYMGVEFSACAFLSILRFFNFFSLLIIIGFFFKTIGGFDSDYMTNYIDDSFPIVLIMIIIFIIIDPILFYSKSNQIKTICEKFSAKRRIAGKIKFFLYILLTIFLFGFTLVYLN